jgi:CTP synthase (UTP-ammonia lyase)
VLVSCPVDNRPDGAPRLFGKLKIAIIPDSLAYKIYKNTETQEPFNCNYELNPTFRGQLESHGLKVSGVSADGGVRIIELLDNRFFIATGFVPQLSSEVNKPHPLIVAYLKAALESG